MEKLITTNDGSTLWSESFGNPADRAVLLIMGAMNQGIFWPDEFCRGLAQAGHHVIRYDHRDTGKSSTVDFQKHPYDLDTLAQDAVAMLQGHRVGKAVIVGLSMGGYIAQLLAIDHPECVDRLVLISTTADHRPYMAATMGQPVDAFSLPAPDNKFLDYLHATAANPPRTAEEIEANMIEGWAVTYGGERPFPQEQITAAIRLAAQRAANPYACFQHGRAVAASPDRLESVKRITAPTLIIHGRYDALLPLPHAAYTAKAISGSQLQIFGMGHSFMWSWSDEVLASISGFIKN
ncbi:MAG: alpha/beta fold hydrolase [Gammaproteobacteria bacterium]|nr:alpha/beta fold hydrolase [Gammaproteobacteria bacterium]MBU1447795.1 alpha/beta fold hydrolase [Gammaproteobacteria bacterium]